MLLMLFHFELDQNSRRPTWGRSSCAQANIIRRPVAIPAGFSARRKQQELDGVSHGRGKHSRSNSPGGRDESLVLIGDGGDIFSEPSKSATAKGEDGIDDVRDDI